MGTPVGPHTSRRVDRVPQSTAATLTIGKLPGHPAAHRVVATGEEPGVVSVQALDAAPGPPDPAARARPAPLGRDGRVSFGRVTAVGLLELVGTDGRLGRPDTSGRLQTIDGQPGLLTHEPVPRRHGSAVIQYGAVPDHNGALVV